MLLLSTLKYTSLHVSQIILQIYFNKPLWNLFVKNLLITEINKVLTFLKTAFFPSVTFKLFLYLSKQHMDTKTFSYILR